MKKILIVDDNKAIVRHLTRRLTRAGNEVRSAENGKDGVEQSLVWHPDLVLMDMHMPVMDGYTAVLELREKNYDGLIVALTASAMVKDYPKSLEVGCNFLITKPVDEDFPETVKQIMEGTYNGGQDFDRG